MSRTPVHPGRRDRAPEPDTIDAVLRDAAAALERQRQAQAELREVETALRLICRRYDVLSGCRGIRPEGLKFAIEARSEHLKQLV